ncbi:MAG TPA: ornithine carbamoyltransferase [Candidatus Fraserbacteria bacterium]|nr:ornithine carbamoyltransferase [Candidatus Fraserbacteria bacterium]
MLTKTLRGRDLVSLMDYSREELETILDLAFALKRKNEVEEEQNYLRGKTLAMIFANPSTRTRTSFEAAMTELGGHAQFHTPEVMQIAHHETWLDTARVLDRYVHGIMIRMYGLEKYGMARDILRLMADAAQIPVYNALDDKEHPFQILADLMTMIEKLGPGWRKKKIVLSWAYSERVKSAGVPQTMAIAASLLGMNLTLAYPEKYDVDPEYIAFARREAEKSGAEIEINHDVYQAAKGADVIYAKSWGSFLMEPQEDREYRKRFRQDWCISKKHFELANRRAIFMHCLPADRNLEVTDEVIDGPMSVVYDEAENRLHTEKAVLALTMR